jgi:triacylglycerol lipase
MKVRRAVVLLVAAALLAATSAAAAPPAAATTAKDPVIIVAGTFSPALANEPLALRLRANGYRVWIFELPTLGTQDINKTARALATFADRVRTSTGSAKVDLIGHSQGALVSRSYVKDFGGATKVDSLISLGGPNQGTYLANLATFLGLGNCLFVVACEQMSIGSTYLKALNAGDQTVGSVRYTAFRTSQDALVRPVGNANIVGATNVLIQSKCWLRVVTHVELITDGTVYSGVRQALEGRPIDLNCFAL